MFTVDMQATRPIKIWARDLEQSALEQARNVANLPFVFKHVSIMPDGHLGYGMPIGGVLAAMGVVVPNAVGVDIGCFVGDTKIPLLDGTQSSLKDLHEKGGSFWVYSLDKDLRLVPGKAVAVKTRENASLVKVTISGGEEIVCTPDQRFMMKDGAYQEAHDLAEMDSLMPLYRTYATRDGYETAITREGKSVRTHVAVAQAVGGPISRGYAVHHKNENRWDNRPENLQVMSVRAHSQHSHSKKVARLKSEEFKEHRLEVLRERGFYSPDLAEKKKAVAAKNITKYMRENPEHFAAAVVGNGERGKSFLVGYNTSEAGRSKSREIGRGLYTCNVCGESGRGGFFLGRHMKFKHGNHKVVKVEHLDRTEDVYCLRVEEHHNFAISAGVFVHNCGMCAMQTGLHELPVEDRKAIMAIIRRKVPVGFSHHEDASREPLMPATVGSCPQVDRQYFNAIRQLGTLGGGNHFIELQLGSDGHVWAMVHSGSRNLGYKVAEYYNNLAVTLNARWRSVVPKEHELAFLPLDTDEAQAYLREMRYCVQFAQANRAQIMVCIKEAIAEVTHCEIFESTLDVAHNYAAMENHFGENVLVHRKGATRARDGELGIIPGSQGTASYIVKGLGNPVSFMSCSHGAGRRMGRKEAVRSLDLAAEQKQLDELGVVHSVRNVTDLDEAPGAYKDIDKVMAAQEDLVTIHTCLTPLAVVKG
jgi:tRNA-splicing ligase RtcB